MQFCTHAHIHLCVGRLAQRGFHLSGISHWRLLGCLRHRSKTNEEEGEGGGSLTLYLSSASRLMSCSRSSRGAVSDFVGQRTCPRGPWLSRLPGGRHFPGDKKVCVRERTASRWLAGLAERLSLRATAVESRSTVVVATTATTAPTVGQINGRHVPLQPA